MALRNRKKGYAVSIIKAVLEVIGRKPGPVRPPLTDLTGDELTVLRQLMEATADIKAAAQ